MLYLDRLRLRNTEVNMTRVHAQLIGDKAIISKDELDQLIELARKSEKVDLDIQEEDVPTIGIMKLAEQSGSFNFWKDDEENIYTDSDGEKF
jgi:hypothetical protein